MMRIVSSLLLATLLGLGTAQAQVGGTEIVLYRFAGVRDDGGGIGMGVATVFHCTNFSGVTETIRFVLRDFDATLISNRTVNIAHLRTIAVSTHDDVAYAHTDFLSSATPIMEGSLAIAATTTSIVCTAMTIDASNPVPVGVSLHGVRFSPIPGTEE